MFQRSHHVSIALRPHQSQVKVKVTLRLTVSQWVSLGVEPHLGLMTRFLLLVDCYGLLLLGRPLWWEDGSVFCTRRPYFTLSDFRLPFSSPPTTHRVTVEVFGPAYSVWTIKSKPKLCYDRRFSRPVRFGIKHPSGAYDQIFITVRQLQACWCRALSLTRGRVCRFPYSVSSNTSLVSMYNLHVTSY
jgi:hypothetical protein